VGDIMRVESGEVYRISDAVLDTAGRIDRMADGIWSWAHLAADAIEGSPVCNPLASEVSAFWREALEGLAGEVRGFGTDIRDAAASYEATDDTARFLVHRAAG
jgi:hypothetical protein